MNSDVLEKNRFLVALFEYFTNFDCLKEENDLSLELNEQIIKYFSDYESFDLSHWNLLEYETKDEKNDDFPELYMSIKQQEDNHKLLDRFLNDILQIFKKFNSPIDSCESLLEFYLNKK